MLISALTRCLSGRSDQGGDNHGATQAKQERFTSRRNLNARSVTTLVGRPSFCGAGLRIHDVDRAIDLYGQHGYIPSNFNTVLGLRKVSVTLAPLVAGMVLLAAAAGTLKRWAAGRKLDAQTGAESLGQLSWHEFEHLLAEAFRREGYSVEPGGGNAPDGGVDLRLFREGRLLLVQCKHWKARKVGVKIVRELRGVMASKGADGGIVVTSGKFTADAVDFERSSGIRLVEGEELLMVIRAAQRRPQVSASGATITAAPMQTAVPVAAPQAFAPACSKCGGAMIIRTAQKGPNAGNRFWGCSGYPRCRGIVNVAR